MESHTLNILDKQEFKYNNYFKECIYNIIKKTILIYKEFNFNNFKYFYIILHLKS